MAVVTGGGPGRHPASRGSRRGVTRQTLPAASLLVLAGLVLVGVGMRERDALVIGVGCLPVAAYLVSLAWGWRLGVRARLAVPTRAIVGEPMSLLLRLQSDGAHGLPATTLSVVVPCCEDTVPPLGPAAAAVGPSGTGHGPGPGPSPSPSPIPGSSHGPGGQATAPAHARPATTRRPGLVAVPALAGDDEQWVVLQHVLEGRGPAGQARATGQTTAPFGLVKHTWTVGVDTGLLVWPARRPPHRLPGGGLDGQGRPAGIDRTGSDVQGVREYRPGDDRRHVHWRSSARRGSLVVTERERLDADDAAVLVLCPPRRARVDPLAAAAHAEWEELVARAAWTLVAALSRGSKVLVAATGRGDPQAGPVTDPGEVLDWFARLPGACEPVSARPWWTAGVRGARPPASGGPVGAGPNLPWQPVTGPAPAVPELAGATRPGATQPVATRPVATQPGPTQPGPSAVGPLPPDLSDAVGGLLQWTRRGEQVLLLAATSHPQQALHVAAGAVAAAGRRPLAWGEWLR